MTTKSNFEGEIFQQPDVIRRLLETKNESTAQIASELNRRNVRFAIVAARGTSDNAARYTKYMLGAYKKLPVGLAMPSLYTLYEQPVDMHDCLVIGISQSGQSTDVVAVLQEARRQNAPTLAITNFPDSPLAEAADYDIILDVGEEKSVAASKTYTAQLTATAMLTAYWSASQELREDLHRLPVLLQEALERAAAAETIAQEMAEKERLVVIGRGYNYCTALEVGLKIKELSYISAQAYSSADFRHGPVALLQPGFPVIAIAPLGKTSNDMRGMIADIHRIGADQVVITNDPELSAAGTHLIRLPDHLPEWLSPIVGVIPGQLLALHLAQAKGLDVDHPRGLHKVTLTV